MRSTRLLLLTAAALLGGEPGAAQAGGFATYFARINANGTVARSSGVADSKKISAGVYEITFNRSPLNGCGFVAGVTGNVAGSAIIELKSIDIVTVRTFAPNGALANRSFGVIVTCAP